MQYTKGRLGCLWKMAMHEWMKTGKLDSKRKHSESETSKEKKAKQATKSQSLKFQKSWLDDFEWLQFDSQLGSKGLMHCAICRDTNLPSHSNKKHFCRRNNWSTFKSRRWRGMKRVMTIVMIVIQQGGDKIRKSFKCIFQFFLNSSIFEFSIRPILYYSKSALVCLYVWECMC